MNLILYLRYVYFKYLNFVYFANKMDINNPYNIKYA